MPDIPLDGFIDKPRVDWVISNLKPGDRLVINSPGGSLMDAIRLADHVRKNKTNTHVNSTGIAHSSAALVFSAGVKRTAGKNAQFMIHPAVKEGSPNADAIALFQNKLINFGVIGTKDFIKAQTEDWVVDYDTAKAINLVNSELSPTLGPLQ